MRATSLLLLLGLLLAPAAPAAPIKVMLNPSDQENNAVAGGGTEDQYALINAKKVEAILDAAGFDAKVDQSFENAAANANSWGATIFVSIHSNAGNKPNEGHGTETLYKTDAPTNPLIDDKVLATKVQNALLANLPYKSRGIKVRTDLKMLNATTMPVCLAEVVFHDCSTLSGFQGHPPSESAFLKSTDGQNKIAKGLSEGVCAYFGVDCDGTVQPPAKGWLTGIVYKTGNVNDRLPGAKVTLSSGPSMTTGGDALYSFELAPGAYTATASLAGYQSASVTRTVVAGKEVWGSIGLSPIVCDDQNPCTTDTWGGGACVYANNTKACDDGNACTGGDACAKGSCKGLDLSATCDDWIACTADACDPEEGCENVRHDSWCDDDNPCTDDDCSASEGCLHFNNSDACNDGLPCTTKDRCVSGACQGLDPRNCVDLDPCTVDSCEPSSGICLHSFIPGCGLDPEDVAEDTEPGPDTVSWFDTEQPLPDTALDGQADGGQGDALGDLSQGKDRAAGAEDLGSDSEDGHWDLGWTRPQDLGPGTTFKSGGGCSTGGAPGRASAAGLLLLLGLALWGLGRAQEKASPDKR